MLLSLTAVFMQFKSWLTCWVCDSTVSASFNSSASVAIDLHPSTISMRPWKLCRVPTSSTGSVPLSTTLANLRRRAVA